MARSGWKNLDWLEIAQHGWKRLDMAENLMTWLEMHVNCWTRLEMAGMTEICWKWLEKAAV